VRQAHGGATTTPNIPLIDCERLQPVLPVGDIVAAADFYTTKLGFRLAFTYGDPPTFAGVNLGSVQVFLSRNLPESRIGSVCFVVGDADQLYAFQQSQGVEIVEPIGDRDYGIRDYMVRDPYGNLLAFGHYSFHTGPPIKVERVDVPLRLEKRLAALLHDLAEHKHMSLTSCLEEILLHTNEPYGDGVASPHTAGTLRYIQELKKKHGIDYDSHGSYRFVEE
jgi:catechol 2,3-dioxygenase-like lactoylglutathione lyase family enzyme